MRCSRFETELWLPGKRDEVFPFFAEARNLEAITPPWLHFEILTEGEIPMRVGTLIDYRLRIRGVTVRWQTEITGWEPPVRFVDEQRRGPYRKWVHVHTFEEREGGTLCRDEVQYAVPGGWLMDRLLVRRDVARIFTFRGLALRQKFGSGVR